MYFIVVKRGDFRGYDLLHDTFGQRMSIVWERRRAERRRAGDSSSSTERRQRQRRGPSPTSWNALGFVVVESQE